MTKPIGPICNLDCRYCYYLEKETLYPRGENFRMKPQVLESYIRQTIELKRGGDVLFAWQGGEPTLLGIDSFRQVVSLQRKYAGLCRIENALQTNGTRLDAEWCRFFREEGFLIGVSIDGPKKLHDRYRVDKGGRPTFDRVMEGINLMKSFGVEFNTLTVVNSCNAQEPLKVYEFLKEIGSGFIQFIPLVERVIPEGQKTNNLTFAPPPMGG